MGNALGITQGNASIGIILNGKDNASQAFESATRSAEKFESRGLGLLNEKLERLKSSMRGFNSILELGFGFQIGRKIFDQIHESVVNLYEGFTEGLKAGESFGDAMASAGRKMLGLKTETEETTERVKALADNLEKIKGARGSIRDMLNPTPAKYSFMSNSKEYEGKIADLTAARDEAAKIVGSGTEYGDWMAFEQRYAARVGKDKYHTAEGLRGIRERSAELRNKYGPALAQLNFAENALANSKSEVTQRNMLIPFANSMRSLFFGGDGSNQMPYMRGYDSDIKQWYGRYVGAGPGIFGGLAAQAGMYGDALSEAGGRAFGWLGRLRPAPKVGDPTLPPEINQQIRNLSRAWWLSPQQKQIEAAKIAGSFGSFYGIDKSNKAAGAIGAENQRFLTRGPGPIKTPELTELEKIARAMEELGLQKIPDLINALKGFGPIGVVDK